MEDAIYNGMFGVRGNTSTPISAKPFNTYRFQTADIKNQPISANAFPAVEQRNSINDVPYEKNSYNAYEKWYINHKEDFGDNTPKTFAEFEKWMYNKGETKEALNSMRKQIDTVLNAPCELTQKKITGFMLEPNGKHSKDFFDIGYSKKDSLLLKADIAEQFDMKKAVDIGPGYKEPQITFSIFMELGVTEKKRFRTVWQIDSPGAIPRIITNHRED